MSQINDLLPKQQAFNPNDVHIECICVPKIFDWVIIPASIQQLVSIPAPCLQALQNISHLTVECMSSTNVFQHLQPDQTQVLSLKRSVPGLPDQMAVTSLACSVPVTLSFLDRDLPQSPPIWMVKTDIQVRLRDVVICLPEPLNKQNMTCRVISCEGTGIVLGEKVQLHLDLCVTVLVEAEVKLEIPAKFCQPRHQPIRVLGPSRPTLCPIPITDEFCGNFRIECNQKRETLWENLDISPPPSGTITITLEEGCPSLFVIINETQVFEVKKGESRSLTFELLEKVEIECSNSGRPCLGKYCMSIHYFVFVPAEKDSPNS
jgi:hypothetical protein